VTASNLVDVGGGQRELFPDPERVRQQALDGVVDRVRGRFGAKLGRGLKGSRVKVDRDRDDKGG
jgi:hypothetical protein